MILVPYKMETVFTRYPIANSVIIAATSIFFFLPIFDVVSYDDLVDFVLRDWDASQIIGSLFLHGDIFHLLGNMLFLWVFGNAVNAAVGNVSYPFLYLILGICAAVTHLSADAHAAIGASGAINGIVGMVLVLFPYNRIHNYYWFALPMMMGVRSGRFQVKAIWMILYWNIFDFAAVALGSEDGVGHWAHIGGLMFGVGYGFLAVKFKLVETYSPSILDVFAGNASEANFTTPEHVQEGLTTQFDIHARVSELSGGQSVPSVEQQTTPVQHVKVNPEIHLTHYVGGGSTVTCHFANKGGPMKCLKLRVPQGVAAEMSPNNALYGGQSGWIRFSTNNGSTIDSIEFILGYIDKLGGQKKKRFRCVPSKNTLTEVVTS